jgi:hypothetical protein
VCLASQYAYITAAAQEGRTFTEISTEHLGSSDDSATGSEDQNTRQDSDHARRDDETTGRDGSGEEDILETQSPNHTLDEKALNNQGQFNLHIEDEEQPFFVDSEASQHAYYDGEDPGHFQEQDKSIGSTVRGDEPELEGEYDTSFDIDIKSSAIGHLYNANMIADRSAEVQDTASPDFSESADNHEDDKLSHNSEAEEFMDNNSVHSGTNSSHTIEGDEDKSYEVSRAQDEVEHDNNENQHQGETESNTDDQDPGELDIEALFEEGHTGADAEVNGEHQDSQAEPAVTGEDDFLDLEIDNHDHFEHHSGSLHVEEDSEPEDLFNETGTSELLVKNDSFVDGSHVSSAETPSTPSKGNPAKRKIVDDEDEFDLLDFETPDTKRRRPS